MAFKRAARTLRRCGAIIMVAALLFVSPVFATGESTGTPVPAPAPSPAPDRAPVTEPARTPPSTDETSPIEAPVDPETLKFRAQLAAKQAELDAFMAQLDELDRELAIAAEAYNQAVDRLESTKQKVTRTEQDLDGAQRAYEFQVELLNSRASSIYKDGAFATIELLIDSKSLNDFIARVKFLNTIGLADAEVAKSLRGQKELVEQAAADLKDSETRAIALEFELKARQIEVLLRIQDRQSMIANAESDLLALLDSEAARRNQEEALLLRQILADANAAGIVVTPGSPIETALAYHGIPYLWGGETPAGFDCSGLVLYVFRQHGVELPHYSGSQFLLGEKVTPSQLEAGDVVFFGSPIHHVGIYLGGGYYIHAPRTGDFIKISALAGRKDFAGARRYNWVPRVGAPRGVSVNPADPLASLR